MFCEQLQANVVFYDTGVSMLPLCEWVAFQQSRVREVQRHNAIFKLSSAKNLVYN